MPQFTDDLFLGAATTYMGMNLDDSSPMSQGVGPLGRIYVWDTVPLAKGNANIAAASVWTGTVTLTAGTGVNVTSGGVTVTNGGVTVNGGNVSLASTVGLLLGAASSVAGTAASATFNVLFGKPPLVILLK